MASLETGVQRNDYRLRFASSFEDFGVPARDSPSSLT